MRRVIGDQEAIDLVRDLVATPSVSGSERPAVALLATRMAAMGFRASIDEAGNAVGELGSTSPDAREIVLLGHIDTVPGHIPVRIDDDNVLWGRGSVDAKGPLAAFVIGATNAAIPDDVRVVVVGAVGEETPTSPGATYIRDRRRPHACIIGEPSQWDRFTLGYKGRLLVEAAFEQSGAHSAGPQGTAAERAVDWFNDLRAWTNAQNDAQGALFDQLQIALQRFVTDSDGLTDRATLTVGFRLPTRIAPRELERMIAQRAEGVSLRFDGHTPAVRAERSNPVANALAGAIADQGVRARPVVKTGTSDMNTVAGAWGCPIVAYGPGDSALDHAPDERLPLDEYLRATRVLAAALSTLASEREGVTGRITPEQSTHKASH